MPRPKMSEEEKERRKAYRESAAGRAEALEKLKARQAALEAQLAQKQHPELKDPINSVNAVVTELGKIDRTISGGVQNGVTKQKESIARQIEHYEEKIAGLRKDLTNLSEDRLRKSLQEDRTATLKKLKAVVNDAIPRAAKAKVQIESLVPALKSYMAELEKVPS